MPDKPKLETRTCQCGCGKQFKVLPNSNHWYFAMSHMPDMSDDIPFISSTEREEYLESGVDGIDE